MLSSRRARRNLRSAKAAGTGVTTAQIRSDCRREAGDASSGRCTNPLCFALWLAPAARAGRYQETGTAAPTVTTAATVTTATLTSLGDGDKVEPEVLYAAPEVTSGARCRLDRLSDIHKRASQPLDQYPQSSGIAHLQLVCQLPVIDVDNEAEQDELSLIRFVAVCSDHVA